MKPVRKAVFPVAGLGTRILPATKAMPKEMLPIVDKPLIQYAVEEAREAGIEQMIFVTGRGKGALEDHFEIAYELEAVMTARGKTLDPLAGTRFPPGAVVSVRQQSPLGLGHAVWCAREIVGDEPFAVLLPDDLMVGTPGCLAQMVAAYEKVGGNIVCAQEVPAERTASYGIITPGARDGRLTEVKGMGLGGVAFLDGADVVDQGQDIDLMNLHWAVGLGLRLFTIVGPVRADVGYRLNRTGPGNPDAGSHWAFHLSIGEAY